jgi:pimeloyl-ACP methyl ester carboxylesterase
VSRDPTPFEIAAGEVRIRGLDYGDPSLPAMVVVHGMRDHAHSFDPVARAFLGEFRVLVPDLRGHGRSDRPGSYAMAQFVADLHALVLAFSLDRPVLVGHSLGGQIAAHYAGLFAEIPAALLCIEGLGPPRRPEDRSAQGRRERMRERTIALLERSEPREGLADLEAAVARFRARHPRLPAARARSLVEHATEPGPGGGLRWRWAPEVHRVWSTIGLDETEEVWSWIRSPVLVVTASESASWWTRRGLSEPILPSEFSAELERKLAIFADAEHVIIEGSGHMVHYDQPEALVGAMRDFLGRRCSLL